MKILRTPDANFENLSNYPFTANYTNIRDNEGNSLRIHHIEEGPNNAAPLYCLCMESPDGLICTEK